MRIDVCKNSVQEYEYLSFTHLSPRDLKKNEKELRSYIIKTITDTARPLFFLFFFLLFSIIISFW